MNVLFAEGSTSALSGLGDVVSDVLGYMGTVITTVTSTPILMAFVVGIPLLSLGIGLFKRLVHARA